MHSAFFISLTEAHHSRMSVPLLRGHPQCREGHICVDTFTLVCFINASAIVIEYSSVFLKLILNTDIITEMKCETNCV